jgi:cytochrome P450
LRESPSNLIEAMLVERESPGTNLTDYDVSSNVITMLLAGEDTTANTLAWLIYLASRGPAVMERLADEASAVLGDMRFAERLEVASALKSPVREFVRGAISHCSKSIW